MSKLNKSKQRKPTAASRDSLAYDDRPTVSDAKLAANRAKIARQEATCREYWHIDSNGKMTRMVRQ